MERKKRLKDDLKTNLDFFTKDDPIGKIVYERLGKF
jgi:hypothetical protein